jgi:NAD(P)-dependent dehydrogenase (short-subunit alcohol dehydrogenase family)
MQILLKNKIVVITGGAGLIGRVFARAVVENGGMAIVADLDLASACKISAEIEVGYPGFIKFAEIDITNTKSIQGFISEIDKEYGRIDAVVNNAYPRNSNYGKKLEDISYEDFCENVSLHLGGYFLVAQQFCKYFKTQNIGNIINISSIYGVIAPRFDIYNDTAMTMPVEYAATKSAIIHMTKYFSRYFKGYNIRVNCISPGGILDGQPQIFLDKYNSYSSTKGMLDAKDLQGAFLFLTSDMSKYVFGQNIIVDDGWSL